MSAAATIVFYAPDSPIGRAIDRGTGGIGYSHVAVELDDGRLIDCVPVRGVHVASPARYDGRPAARVRLPGKLGELLRDCLLRKLGRPWTLAASCSGIVWDCWAQHKHPGVGADLARYWRGRPPTSSPAPNDLALFFRAELGTVRDYDGQENIAA